MLTNTANVCGRTLDNFGIFGIKKIVTALLKKDIANMRYQLHHLHFEEYFIQQIMPKFLL